MDIPWKVLLEREEPVIRSRKGVWPPPKPRWRQIKDWIDDEVLSRVPWPVRLVAPIPESTDDWAGWADAAVSLAPQKLAMLPMIAIKSPRGRRLLKDALGFDLAEPVRVVRWQAQPPYVKEGRRAIEGSNARNSVFATPVLHGNVDRAVAKAQELAPRGMRSGEVVHGLVRVENPLLVGDSALIADTLSSLNPDDWQFINILPFLKKEGSRFSFASANPFETGRALSRREQSIVDALRVLPTKRGYERWTNQALQHPETHGDLRRAATLVLPDVLAGRRAWLQGFDAIIPLDTRFSAPHLRRPVEIALKPDYSRPLDEGGRVIGRWLLD